MVERMIGIRVSITRYVSDDQPGFVECEFRDAHGILHRFVEKVPIVTADEINAESTYPHLGIIDCRIVNRRTDVDGTELISVDTNDPSGVESMDGQTRFDVKAEQLIEWDWGQLPLNSQP